MTSVYPGRIKNEFNLVAQARRQAGSTFKTFVLTQAVDDGMNPASTSYVSAPFTWQPDPAVPPWSVSTYSHSYSGLISVQQATLQSDNTVYAKLTLDVGPQNVADMAHKLGVQSPLRARSLDRARLQRRLAAGHGLGLRHPRRRRRLLAADGDPQSHPRRTARRTTRPDGAGPCGGA